MKLAKLSLAAIIVSGLTVDSFAADTLADAIRNTELSGVLRQVYREKQTKEPGEDDVLEDGFSIGARLEGRTGKFMGFTGNFGFQTSTTPDMISENNDDKAFAQDATNMHILNLSYSYAETALTVGRFFIKTPLLKNRDSRILKDYNDGAYITNTSIPNTELIAGVVTGYQWIDQDVDKIKFDKPLYTLYANTAIGDLKLTAQMTSNESVNVGYEDGSKDYYVEAKYKIKGDFPITLGPQYIKWQADDDFKDSFDDNYGEDGWDAAKASSMYGLMAKIELPYGFGLGVHYTKIADKDGQVKGGWGESLDPSYNSMIITDGNEKGYETYRGTLYYEGFGLETDIYYAHFDQHSATSSKDLRDTKEIGIEAVYKFSGAFKGLSLETQLAKSKEESTDKEKTQIRFYTEYKF